MLKYTTYKNAFHLIENNALELNRRRLVVGLLVLQSPTLLSGKKFGNNEHGKERLTTVQYFHALFQFMSLGYSGGNGNLG